eukprot:16380072-Heterocapsa_arctica.AAC.1
MAFRPPRPLREVLPVCATKFCVTQRSYNFSVRNLVPARQLASGQDVGSFRPDGRSLPLPSTAVLIYIRPDRPLAGHGSSDVLGSRA